MPLSRIQTDAIKDAITTSNILDGTILPADLSTGRPAWDTSSNVGIGTNSPSVRLHVMSSETGYATTAAETVTKAAALFRTHSSDSTVTSFGAVGTGHGYIQRTNGSGSSQYSLVLNPFGGGVGIGTGTATPSSMLTVKASGASGIVLDTDGGDSTSSTRLFGKNATSTGCIFHFDNSGNPIWCFTSGSTIGSSTGTTRLTISPYGLALGNYDAATSGTGIKFPVAQNASSDPNTLDDYEEGTWTPSLLNSGTATYGTRAGRYTKIGRLVTLFYHIDVSVVGTASGVVSITGFPFTSISTGDIYGHGGTPHCQSFSGARSGVHILVPINATSGDVYVDSGNGAAQLTWATLGSGNMLGSIKYEST
jgi:hypothetical protein